jgi:hypothetical protein
MSGDEGPLAAVVGYRGLDRLGFCDVYRRVIALIAICSPLTAQATDTTLMLACQGTAMDTSGPVDGKPEPTSMGIIINFTDRTGPLPDWRGARRAPSSLSHRWSAYFARCQTRRRRDDHHHMPSARAKRTIENGARHATASGCAAGARPIGRKFASRRAASIGPIRINIASSAVSGGASARRK